MLVKNVMSPVPEAVSPRDPIRKAYEIIQRRGFHQLPVVDGGRLVGIVSDRNLRSAGAAEESARGMPVADVMSKNPRTASPDDPIEKAARILHDQKFNALPVVDEEGRLAGIITKTDLLQVLLEILGPGEDGCRVDVLLTEGIETLKKLADGIHLSGGQIRSIYLSGIDSEGEGGCVAWIRGCSLDVLLEELDVLGLKVLGSYG